MVQSCTNQSHSFMVQEATCARTCTPSPCLHDEHPPLCSMACAPPSHTQVHVVSIWRSFSLDGARVCTVTNVLTSFARCKSVTKRTTQRRSVAITCECPTRHALTGHTPPRCASAHRPRTARSLARSLDLRVSTQSVHCCQHTGTASVLGRALHTLAHARTTSACPTHTRTHAHTHAHRL